MRISLYSHRTGSTLFSSRQNAFQSLRIKKNFLAAPTLYGSVNHASRDDDEKDETLPVLFLRTPTSPPPRHPMCPPAKFQDFSELAGDWPPLRELKSSQ